MQNFLTMAPDVAETSSFRSSAGEGRTGPEALSSREVAAVLSKVLGRPIVFHALTFEEQKQAMISFGLPEMVAKDNAKALSLFAAGEACTRSFAT